jgi:hypothetical protein
MNEFHVERGGTTATFDSQTGLLAHLEAALGGGDALAILIPKAAIQVVGAIVELLKRNRIDMVLLADSEPETADYVAQTLLGGAVGTVVGVGGAVCALSALARAGCAIPVVGWFLAAAAVVGVVAGAAAGFGMTRMGLRVRLVRAGTMRMELVRG